MDKIPLRDKTKRVYGEAGKKRNLKIAKMRVGGMSQREIGRKIGLKRNAVSAILNKKDIKEYIQGLTAMLVEEEAGEAYLNLSYAINSYQSKDADPQLREHGFKASGEVLRSLGVLESNKVSVNFTNITNSQTTIVSPVIQDLIRRHFGIQEPPKEIEEVIDVTEA
jgi:transcriptional regulator with XRE-family HTH domain